MIEFTFETDSEAYDYCHEIVAVMMRDFGISENEAIARLNRQWNGQKLGGPEELLFHELPETWAYDVYFGKGSAWWTKANTERRPLPPP